MSEDKTRTTILADAKEEDLDFTVVQMRPKLEVPANKPAAKSAGQAKVTVKKSDSLRLEKVDYNAKLSRGELYKELIKDEEKSHEDIYVYASPVSRGIALIIDLGFNFVLVRASLLAAPFELKALEFAMSKYKLQLDLPVQFHIPLFIAITIFLAFFFMVVIPGAFFNTSLGKKLTGLRLRGVDIYTLTIPQVFCRELFYKPLSIGLLAGLVMPFFSEHKQSLHDKLSGTLVIKD